jgi:hypothetical protein
MDVNGQTRPVSVEVVVYAPTAFFHCQHCELTFGEVGLGERIRREQARSALPEDLGLEFQVLSDWIRGLIERHGRQVHVRVVDAASIRGFATALRHRIGRYPAVILDGREKLEPAELATLDPLIDRRVAERSQSGRPTREHAYRG